MPVKLFYFFKLDIFTIRICLVGWLWRRIGLLLCLSFIIFLCMMHFIDFAFYLGCSLRYRNNQIKYQSVYQVYNKSRKKKL